MKVPTYKPYSFKRSSNVTQFYYGDVLMFDISNMADNVAEAITIQLNIAFEAGVDMAMNSALKSIEKNFTSKQS